MRNETFGNSLVREHFTIEGTPKVRRSKEDAETYAVDHGLVAYLCAFCNYWHVGTEKNVL